MSRLTDDAHVVVSEPLGDLPGAWIEIEPGTALTITRSEVREQSFTPAAAVAL
jgi:glutamine amidotransferase